MLLRNFKSHSFALLLCGLTLACNPSSDSNEAANGSETPSSNTGLVPSDRTPGEADRRATEETEALRKQLTAEKNNTTSPYRYVITTDDYSIFASLLQASTLSKHIHSAGTTLLAPRNRAFDGNTEYTNWLKEKNVAKIDAFIAPYILKSRISYKELKEQTTLPNYLGEDLKVSVEGGVTVGGASVSTEEVFTKNGILIGMNELMTQR